MNKPNLHNWFNIWNDITILNRIDKLFFTEVYKLSNEKFLYLFLDINENDILNSDIEIIKITINNNIFIWTIVDEFSIKFLSSIKENLISINWFNSIAWMDQLKNKLLEEIIIPFKNKEKFKKYKVSLPNWLLFYWPPWCWKTYISTKLADELWWNFMEVKHSTISSPYIHWTVWKIWQVFEKAKLKSPVILFFDEISWLVPNRNNLTWEGTHKEEEINEFLINLDDAWNDWILVVWATNYPNKIDPAILRTWRFDLKLYIWPPDKETRVSLFSFYLNWRPLESNIDYNKLADLTENYIISDIEFIIESVAKKAAIMDKLISYDMLVETIKWISKSISDSELKYFDSIYLNDDNDSNDNKRKIWFSVE